jgi:hypothetical protein
MSREEEVSSIRSTCRRTRTKRSQGGHQGRQIRSSITHIQADIVQMSQQMDFTYDKEKTIFCCGVDGTGLLKHGLCILELSFSSLEVKHKQNADYEILQDVRASAAYLQEDKHSQIHDFIAAANSGDIDYGVNQITAAEVKAIKTVIKVNDREDFEDVATVLFALTSEFTANPKNKYTAFEKLDTPQRFENMGERAYIAFYCRKHKKTYRVGMHQIKWNKKAAWASWENKEVDDIMGHPQKPVNNFGQPPVPF